MAVGPQRIVSASPTRVNLVDRFKRHWLSAVFFLVPLTAYLVGALLLHLPESFQHITLTLTAVMAVHVLDRLFLFRDVEESLNDLIRGVRRDISDQTASLISASQSIEAMDHCGIVRIYPNRTAAAPDLRSDLSDPANSTIKLIGISLNDFVVGTDPHLRDTWMTIQAFVRGQRRIDDPKRGLEIRVLLIDPRSFGAKLRSESESQSLSALARRLDTEVNAAATDLATLEQEARPSETGVTFSCRLYRLPPILFLCWADSACYLQQYHFWSSRDGRAPTPVLKFRRLAASAVTYPYHKEMEHHFDWIWQHASVPVREYLEGAVVGTDQAIQECAAENIYTVPKTASTRIVHLLGHAEKKVSIQGISLSSFFRPGPLREALSNVLENTKAELQILLLDPDSEQAKYRSYRERLFVSTEQSFDSYLQSGEHEKSDLYHDTKRTIEFIRDMVNDVRRTKTAGSASWSPRLEVGLYASAPACFVLRVDDRVLVEQYHYGKVVRHTRAVLGKDMPLFEYAEAPSSLYQDGSDPLRRPFRLLVDHFEYALAQSRRVDIGDRVAHPAAEEHIDTQPSIGDRTRM